MFLFAARPTGGDIRAYVQPLSRLTLRGASLGYMPTTMSPWLSISHDHVIGPRLATGTRGEVNPHR